MPTTLISVDATVDGKKVGGGNGSYGTFMTIEDTDERTWQGLLLDFLKDKGLGDANNGLPSGSNVFLRCIKMIYARLCSGRSASDVGLSQDCTLFFVVSGSPRDRRGADKEVLVLLHPSCRSTPSAD